MSVNDYIDKELKKRPTTTGTQEIVDLKDIEFWNINLFTRGIEWMPDWLGCFDKKDLVTLAGYPSSGKTEFTFFLAKNNANNRQKTLYISLELPSQQLVERLARKKSWITKKQRQDQDITEQQMDRMNLEFNKIKNIKDLEIVSYKHAPTVEMLEATMKKYKDKWFNLFFIDNLWKIAGNSNENTRFDNITSSLQDFKNHNNCCIFLLHHLSKPWKQFTYMPWWIWGIRWSQKIIDNSSLVFEIFRDLDPDADQDDKRKVQLILYKDTMDWATGNIDLEFDRWSYKLFNKNNIIWTFDND